MRRQPRPPDSDLTYGASANGLTDQVENIRDVIAQVPGEADGPHWYWVCKMKNGNYGFFWGWCDYSGWDCQSDLQYLEDSTYKKVLNRMINSKWGDAQKSIRKQLFDQIEGKQPYGIREP